MTTTPDECQCLPLAETFHRGVTGQPVPRCEVHNTIGTTGQQPEGDADALNSEALERKLADSLNTALSKGRFLDL